MRPYSRPVNPYGDAYSAVFREYLRKSLFVYYLFRVNCKICISKMI